MPVTNSEKFRELERFLSRFVKTDSAYSWAFWGLMLKVFIRPARSYSSWISPSRFVSRL